MDQNSIDGQVDAAVEVVLNDIASWDGVGIFKEFTIKRLPIDMVVTALGRRIDTAYLIVPASGGIAIMRRHV